MRRYFKIDSHVPFLNDVRYLVSTTRVEFKVRPFDSTVLVHIADCSLSKKCVDRMLAITSRLARLTCG